MTAGHRPGDLRDAVIVSDAGDGIRSETVVATRWDGGVRYERIDGDFEYGVVDEDKLRSSRTTP
jgi:hypothetical protein